MFSLSRILIFGSMFLVVACRLFAQMPSFVPRTPSQNLTEGLPSAFPSYNKVEGDTLTITGRQTKAYFVKGKPVTFKPEASGVKGIIRTYFFVNNRVVVTDSINTGETLPIYPYTRVENEASGKRVQVIALTEEGKRFSLADCMLYSYAPTVALDYIAMMQGERGEFTFKNRSKLGTVHCYINETSIGKLSAESSTASCDLRHLPAGNYRFAAIAETPDGYLLPFQSYPFTIAPRFRLELPQITPDVPITVAAEQPNSSLVVRAVRDAVCSATLARVFADDNYIGDVTIDVPEIVLPLRDLPTGKIVVEVVPVGKDKFDYPAETIAFTLKNPEWEQKTHRTPEYAQIQKNLKRISDHEKAAVNWIAKAEDEPNFSLPSANSIKGTSTSQIRYTVPFLSTLKMTGRAGQYVGSAREAVISMAQLTLENARLHKKLRMHDAAKANYHNVVYLAGDKTYTGSLAQGELTAMQTRKR